ncbi:MAG: polysaccharide deacetylase family protein [Candidatus Pacebacteria bacterium]|nr:polysaccharide deacetylase family protein [Candidatus Paceibacterota bacterium]
MKRIFIFTSLSIFIFSFVSYLKISQNSSSKVLGVVQNNNIIRNIKVSENAKVVALTFDDGPAPITRDILDILEQEDVKVTFFVVGKNIDLYPDILQEIAQSGHEIGNHSNTHPFTFLLDKQELAKDILINEEKIYQQTGIRPNLFRAPYALYPKNLLETTDMLNLEIISWDVDPEDWKMVNKEIIVNRVMKDVKPGSIILLHDGPPELDRANTLEALKEIIIRLKEDGYQFLTISEYLMRIDSEMEQMADLE